MTALEETLAEMSRWEAHLDTIEAEKNKNRKGKR